MGYSSTSSDNSSKVEGLPELLRSSGRSVVYRRQHGSAAESMHGMCFFRPTVPVPQVAFYSGVAVAASAAGVYVP